MLLLFLLSVALLSVYWVLLSTVHSTMTPAMAVAQNPNKYSGCLFLMHYQENMKKHSFNTNNVVVVVVDGVVVMYVISKST